MMNTLENLRKQLHKALESGNPEDILRASRKLDKVIFSYTKKNISLVKESA
ncbi:MAG: Spo0E family sporulation regulatory protein-aspartic acid phosphatase [Acetivibrionales bacterium]